MKEYDLVIRGGTIVDGTGVPKYKADLAVKDGSSGPDQRSDQGRGSQGVGCLWLHRGARRHRTSIPTTMPSSTGTLTAPYPDGLASHLSPLASAASGLLPPSQKTESSTCE